MLQVPVEQPLQVVHWDYWLLSEIVVLEIKNKLGLIVSAFVHLLKPTVEFLVEIFKFPSAPLGLKLWAIQRGKGAADEHILLMRKPTLPDLDL